MSTLENILRDMTNANNEAKITAVAVTLTPTQFTSALTLGYSRKAIWAYNNSHVNSGECYYGYSASMSDKIGSRPIPVGSVVEIPVTTNIPIYFRCDSGELGDIRVEEIA